jgi:alginate O-acetyltransferase complex protein AlgI
VPKQSFIQYASFIFFFPTMVAGPIKRYQEFEPQVQRARFCQAQAIQGVTRILCGVVKQVLIADTFAIWADKLNGPDLFQAGRLTILLWIMAYGFRIYFDFSGYSDIAIGSGYLFGITIPENFNWPYFSRNISEFWRRWHISLGRWIFDYIYIPLGGSRRGSTRTAVNLLITFGASGLWHGASYNFVAWGLWHGVMMIVQRAWTRVSAALGFTLPRALATALTFAGVMFGWGFFTMDMQRVIWVIERMV